MIVVDTTVWIDFFNGAQSSEPLHLQALILQDRSQALTDLIFCETLQGIRDDAIYAKTRSILLAYPILRMDTLAVFEQSANIYRACRRQGVTVRKTIDCLIAAACLTNQVELFHKDADFLALLVSRHSGFMKCRIRLSDLSSGRFLIRNKAFRMLESLPSDVASWGALVCGPFASITNANIAAFKTR